MPRDQLRRHLLSVPPGTCWGGDCQPRGVSVHVRSSLAACKLLKVTSTSLQLKSRLPVVLHRRPVRHLCADGQHQLHGAPGTRSYVWAWGAQQLCPWIHWRDLHAGSQRYGCHPDSGRCVAGGHSGPSWAGAALPAYLSACSPPTDLPYPLSIDSSNFTALSGSILFSNSTIRSVHLTLQTLPHTCLCEMCCSACHPGSSKLTSPRMLEHRQVGQRSLQWQLPCSWGHAA